MFSGLPSSFNTPSSSSPCCSVRGNPSRIQLLPRNLSSSALIICSISSSGTRPAISPTHLVRMVNNTPPLATTASASLPTADWFRISLRNTSPVDTKAISYSFTNRALSVPYPHQQRHRGIGAAWWGHTLPLPGLPNINILSPPSPPTSLPFCRLDNLDTMDCIVFDTIVSMLCGEARRDVEAIERV